METFRFFFWIIQVDYSFDSYELNDAGLTLCKCGQWFTWAMKNIWSAVHKDFTYISEMEVVGAWVLRQKKVSRICSRFDNINWKKAWLTERDWIYKIETRKNIIFHHNQTRGHRLTKIPIRESSSQSRHFPQSIF